MKTVLENVTRNCENADACIEIHILVRITYKQRMHIISNQYIQGIFGSKNFFKKMNNLHLQFTVT